MIVADITIDAGAKTIQQIPANYNTFLYIIKGNVRVGEDEKQLNRRPGGMVRFIKMTLSKVIWS